MQSGDSILSNNRT